METRQVRSYIVVVDCKLLQNELSSRSVVPAFGSKTPIFLFQDSGVEAFVHLQYKLVPEYELISATLFSSSNMPSKLPDLPILCLRVEGLHLKIQHGHTFAESLKPRFDMSLHSTPF